MSASGDHQASWWEEPARVALPTWIGGSISPGSASVAVTVASSTARLLTVLLPSMLAIVGLLLALVGARLSDHSSTEGIGVLGVEVGAAMWFAGIVVLGGRPRPTMLRVALLAALGAGGLALVLAALVGRWSGIALDLAMEFGVGAVAIVVLDVVILGLLQRGLDRVADIAPTERAG